MLIRRFGMLAMPVALIVAMSGPVLAHENSEGWRSGWGMGHMMRGWGRGHMMDSGHEDWMLERIDGRLAFLKAELRIIESQNAAWDDLAKTVKNNAETHNAMMRSMMTGMASGEFFKKPMSDRLSLRITHMETRLEQMRNLKEAVDKLYAVLDGEQKKAANEIALPMMGMGHGMGRHMRHY